MSNAPGSNRFSAFFTGFDQFNPEGELIHTRGSSINISSASIKLLMIHSIFLLQHYILCNHPSGSTHFER
jgi:hypothetical protein